MNIFCMNIGKQINLYREIPLVNLESRTYISINFNLIDNINLIIKWPNYEATAVEICDQISAAIWEPYNE